MVAELRLIDEELKRRESVKIERKLESMKKQLINLIHNDRLLIVLGEEDDVDHEELINPDFNIYIENGKVVMQIY